MPSIVRRGRLRRSEPRVELSIGGAGYIAVVHVLAAQAGGLRIRSVASNGGSSARHLAGGVDARKVRPDQLPDGADVLVVATPPESHEELTLQGLTAGASVLVEKPLTTTLDSADRMVSAAQRAEGDVVARCAENLMHAPIWAEVRRRRPALGTIEHLSLRTLQPPPDWGHFTQPLEHGGVLFDLGPHPIALALDAADEAPTGVRARLSSTRSDGADDDATVWIEFVSGLTAELRLSWTAPEPEWSIQAASPSGVLRVELLPEVLLEHDGEQVEIPQRHVVPDARLEQMGYVDQLLDLVSGAPGQDLASARRVLEVICAAYSSAGEGSELVTLPFTGDRRLTPRQLWGR